VHPDIVKGIGEGDKTAPTEGSVPHSAKNRKQERERGRSGRRASRGKKKLWSQKPEYKHHLEDIGSFIMLLYPRGSETEKGRALAEKNNAKTSKESQRVTIDAKCGPVGATPSSTEGKETINIWPGEKMGVRGAGKKCSLFEDCGENSDMCGVSGRGRIFGQDNHENEGR